MHVNYGCVNCTYLAGYNLSLIYRKESDGD